MQCIKITKGEQCTAVKFGPTHGTTKKSKQSLRTKSKTRHVDPSDDLDTLLAEVALADSTCKFPQCPKKVNLLGILCQFCKKRFCMEHNLAEVHGCGDAAKGKSRGDFQREVREGRKGYDLSGTNRSQLHAKLAKKMEDKKYARQSKTDAKKKDRRNL